MITLDHLLTTTLPWWLLATLRNRFNLRNFVETGTAGGHTAVLASRMFSMVYTIEIDEQVAPHPDLAECRNAIMVRGPGETMLSRIARFLDGPTLFYLDAHWCGGPKLSAKECPLLDELKIIYERPESAQDVVVIDDARMFLAPPPPPHDPAQWPTDAEIRAASRPRVMQLFGDQFILTPEPLWTMY